MLKLISSLWLTNSAVGEPLERSWGQVALAEGDSARPWPPNDGNRTGRWCLAVEFVSGGNFLAHGKVEITTCSQSAGVVMASAHFFPGKVDNRDVRFSAGAKKVVLLVEDERGVRDLLKEYLVEEGFCVLTAPNALCAFEVLQSGARIDALLTDLCMPGPADGRELARFVLNTRSEIKIAILAGRPLRSPDPIARYVKFLMKPASMSEIARLLRSMLMDDATPTTPHFGALEPMGPQRFDLPVSVSV